MDYQLKSISRDSIPEAITKVELYRNLNEPGEAESICRDILAIEPENQVALRLFGMSITDQFTGGGTDRHREAEKAFRQLTDQYERLYCVGLLHERRAKAQLRAGSPPHTIFVLFEQALHCFEQAEEIRPAGNDDAILRWNRCVRILQSHLASELRRDEGHGFDHGDGPPI